VGVGQCGDSGGCVKNVNPTGTGGPTVIPVCR
jgi:hypothetical protein